MHDKRLIGTIVMGFAALCLCAPAAFAKPLHKSDRDRAELHGPVNSVATAQEVTDTDNDQTSVREINVGEQDFDLEGNLTSDKTYMTDFVRERKPEQIDARTTILHSEMGDSIEHYKFDAAGNLVEKMVSYGSDPNGATDETLHYKYDKHGRLIEQDTLGSDGKLQSAILYARDKKGNIASQQTRTKDAKPPYPARAFTYQFDSHGNWIKRSETLINVPDSDMWQYSESQHGPLVRTIGYYEVAPKPAAEKHIAAHKTAVVKHVAKREKPKKQEETLETTTITPTVAKKHVAKSEKPKTNEDVLETTTITPTVPQ